MKGKGDEVMVFDKNIAIFNGHAENCEDALRILSEKFVEAGVVEDNFLEGLLKREETFPTGLPLDDRDFGVAIPHTDPEYVKSTQLGFMTLDEPVIFRFMADPSTEIPVRIIFMMAIREAHGQVEMLSKLMEIFWDSTTVDRFLAVDNIDDFLAIVRELGLDQF